MKKFAPLLLLAVAIGCDVVSTDKDLQTSRSDQNIQLVVTKDKSAVIDLQTLFPNFLSASVASMKGVAYFSNRYVKYTSGQGNVNKFSFSITDKNQATVLVAVNPVADSSISCSDGQPFTYATISNKAALVVNLFNNPEFCGLDPNTITTMGVGGSRPGIDAAEQNTTGLNLALCECQPQGNTAILTYFPPAGFVGRVKFKYYLEVGSTATTPAGLDSAVYYPGFAPYHSVHDAIIDVTE